MLRVVMGLLMLAKIPKVIRVSKVMVDRMVNRVLKVRDRVNRTKVVNRVRTDRTDKTAKVVNKGRMEFIKSVIIN
jgi:hypothetical protein